MKIVKTILMIMVVVLSVRIARAESTPCLHPQGFMPIRTQEELSNIRNNLAGNYFLCNNIALSGQFSSIPQANDLFFTGIFEGNRKEISNLTISEMGYMGQWLGLFRGIGSTGVVRNLKIRNASVFSGGGIYSQGFGMGTIAGRNYGVIENCLISGIGEVQSQGNLMNAGGFAGGNFGTIRTSALDGTYIISGGYSSAGVVAYNNGLVENSSVKGDVTISGGQYSLGGIAGRLVSPGRISNSFVVARVLGYYAGGLVGYLSGGGIVENSYYNRDLNPSIMEVNQNVGTGRTTAQLKSIDTFLPAWDISFTTDSASTTWEIKPFGFGLFDYPRLWWELSPKPGILAVAVD